MNILEGKEKFKETSGKFSEQISEGERLQKEGEEADRILQSMENDGLDSDTQEAARKVLGDYSESYGEATQEVSDQIEGISDTARGHVEGLGESREKVDRNAERYGELAGISELGRASAESGKGKMESDSQAYSEIIDQNEEAIESSRERAKNMQSIISGLFKG